METMYKVIRPTLKFCKNDEVGYSELKELFTDKCIAELIQYGFIKQI
jgi:hypothetical protein